VSAPLLVAQGDADPLVLPTMQRQWVAGRCAAGQQVDFRTYPGLDHLSLVAADSPLTPTLVAWAQARLAGNPAHTTC
jgi:alpha-beta hydrolase superfamily lysophospholipase